MNYAVKTVDFKVHIGYGKQDIIAGEDRNMTSGYLTNKQRRESVGVFGKKAGKRAGFTCE